MPGRSATRHGVDEDRRGRIVEQREREVEATDAVIRDPHVAGVLSRRQVTHDLDTEAVIPQEDVADSRHKDGCVAHGCSSVGSQAFEVVEAEEEAVSGLPQHAEVLAGIVIDEQRHVDDVLVVTLDRLDNGGASVERDVHDVGAPSRMDADAVPRCRRPSPQRTDSVVPPVPSGSHAPRSNVLIAVLR